MVGEIKMIAYYGFNYDEKITGVVSIPWVLYAIVEENDFNMPNDDVNYLEDLVIDCKDSKSLVFDGCVDFSIVDTIEIPDNLIKNYIDKCRNGVNAETWHEAKKIIDYILDKDLDLEEEYDNDLEDYRDDWWKRGEAWNEKW